MEGVILGFFSVNTLIYCIIIWLAVLTFRRIVEWLSKKVAYILPDKYENWWQHGWTTVILPILPFAFGLAAILIFPAYPVPAAFAVSLEGKAAFGLVAGGCSGFVYRFAREQLKKLVEKGPEN